MKWQKLSTFDYKDCQQCLQSRMEFVFKKWAVHNSVKMGQKMRARLLLLHHGQLNQDFWREPKLPMVLGLSQG